MKRLLIKLATGFLNRCGYVVEPKAKPMDNVPAFIRQMRGQ
ncbi:hypothetical protein [Actinobacillus pleuropneumoniae]|uniref:Uncharacterized protein n=1 Tax=Actinobacillus pleuropneumoniae TaxID=715 RepID=A0A3S4Y3S6_ACTPL|nr:hypothetical protein [Actinobacillus pleuropneumoniae]EFM94250.1 hypothetical protein appser9_9960 [Actinobacillus pleuropneumoniae serovar 9 str. CVJ13261]EFM98722.1 hypothetical protein appser11_9950 [Actinobacillus pleuropneumoniae serovar 11 str. 56153]MEE3618174.1 hypothetical protein [Actinobacillus pleuropneumoniae]MEE3670268.1 hypothetical protein [Actinobacillus pleuropneumoniae]WBY06083.1 hypothetical protein PE794_04895 [Actinobacillus pleuropneumoniae]